MTGIEYEQKKAECWENFKFARRPLNTDKKIFDFIFDRAYALGKQEKAAEGEDKLLGVSRKQIDALQGEIFDAIMDAHDDDDWQAAAHYILDVMPRSFAALFGSKCLPYETKNGAKDRAKEPKPAGPKEDKHFDNILKEGFRGHNRLHIAAILLSGILAGPPQRYPIKRALELADALIAECEKGGEA